MELNKLEKYGIGTSELTYDLIERILLDGTKLYLSDEAKAKIQKCRDFLERKPTPTQLRSTVSPQGSVLCATSTSLPSSSPHFRKIS